MKNRIWTASRSLLFILTGVLLNASSAAEPASFRPVPDFFKFPSGWTLGACSAVSCDAKEEIYLFQRGPHPLQVFDKTGNHLRSWGDETIGMAHGLRIDKAGNIWVTDIGNHRVFKFDRDGKLLLALGTGKAGTGNDQFDRPTDVAFGPDGEFYVSDGYGNSRVMKFSPSGAFIKSWGTPGKDKGEFNLPHAIVIDSAGRVIVGDRENKRIQLFDREGKWLDMWEGFSPFGLAFDARGALFVADGYANEIVQLDSSGKITQRFGQKGTAPGQFELPHMLGFDSAGNLYVAEVNGKRFQKFAPK